MQTFRQCNESTLWRLFCDALCQLLNYSALTWRTIHSTGRHGLRKVIRLLTWLWRFILVSPLKKTSNRPYDDYFATPFAKRWTTAPWHEEQSILLGDTGFKVMRLLTWLWRYILVFCVKESIPMFFSRTRNKLRKYSIRFHPWLYKVSFNCAGSQSERM